MDDAVSSDDADEGGEVGETFARIRHLLFTIQKMRVSCHRTLRNHFLAPNVTKQKKESNICKRFDQIKKQHLLDRNRQIMGLKKDNQNLKRVGHS